MITSDDKQDISNQSGLTLPLLPLRDVVVYPHMVVPLFVGREKSINALENAMIQDKKILLVAQKMLLMMTLFWMRYIQSGLWQPLCNY